MSTALEQTQTLINIKNRLEQEHKQEYTTKEFLNAYSVRLTNICDKPTRQDLFKLPVTLKKGQEVSVSALYNGSYTIIIDSQEIKVNLCNLKDYIIYTRKWGSDYLTWKKDFQSYIQVKKYYYSYEDIIQGLTKKINHNISKENQRLVKLINRKQLLLNDFNNRIEIIVNTLNELTEQL